jgi:hypothetical protein
MSLLHRVNKLFEMGVGDVHVELRSTLMGLALELGHGVDASYFSSHSTEPVDVFFLIARTFEERYTGSQRSLEWHFKIVGEYLNAAFVQAIASVARARDRATKLVGLRIDDTGVKYDASILRPLFEGSSSSIRDLTISTGSLLKIGEPRLEKLTVTWSGEASIILPFVQKTGVKTLCLGGVWPSLRPGDKLAPVPDLESLEICNRGPRPGGVRRLCAFISACPNLVRLSVDHQAWEDEYLAEVFLEQVLGLERITELAIPASSELIPIIIPYLARMKSLRKFVTLAYQSWPVLMEAIIWSVPRLESAVIARDSPRDFDIVVRTRNNWLQTAALIAYLPLGDLHRELLSYIHK